MVCVHPHLPTDDVLPRLYPVGCPTMFRELHDNNSEERAPTRRDVRREGVPGERDGHGMVQNPGPQRSRFASKMFEGIMEINEII